MAKIPKINGPFSIVIFDAKKNFFMEKDMFGQRPMYFYDNSEHLIISSKVNIF